MHYYYKTGTHYQVFKYSASLVVSQLREPVQWVPNATLFFDHAFGEFPSDPAGSSRSLQAGGMSGLIPYESEALANQFFSSGYMSQKVSHAHYNQRCSFSLHALMAAGPMGQHIPGREKHIWVKGAWKHGNLYMPIIETFQPSMPPAFCMSYQSLKFQFCCAFVGIRSGIRAPQFVHLLQFAQLLLVWQNFHCPFLSVLAILAKSLGQVPNWDHSS